MTTPKDPKDEARPIIDLTFSGATMARIADLRNGLMQAAAEGKKAQLALELLSRLVLDSHGPSKVRSEYSDMVDAANYIRALLNDLSGIETICKDVSKAASDAKKVMQSLRFGGRLLYNDLLEDGDRERDRRSNKQQEMFNEDDEDDDQDEEDDDEKRAESIAQAMSAREKAERERDRRLDDAPFIATEPAPGPAASFTVKVSEMTPAKGKGRGRGKGK